tara:strand:+ start:77 stop:412 length:336 start_codon:yes stop_codon:yes gene_type:complete
MIGFVFYETVETFYYITKLTYNGITKTYRWYYNIDGEPYDNEIINKNLEKHVLNIENKFDKIENKLDHQNKIISEQNELISEQNEIISEQNKIIINQNNIINNKPYNEKIQ